MRSISFSIVPLVVGLSLVQAAPNVASGAVRPAAAPSGLAGAGDGTSAAFVLVARDPAEVAPVPDADPAVTLPALTTSDTQLNAPAAPTFQSGPGQTDDIDSLAGSDDVSAVLDIISSIFRVFLVDTGFLAQVDNLPVLAERAGIDIRAIGSQLISQQSDDDSDDDNMLQGGKGRGGRGGWDWDGDRGGRGGSRLVRFILRIIRVILRVIFRLVRFIIRVIIRLIEDLFGIDRCRSDRGEYGSPSKPHPWDAGMSSPADADPASTILPPASPEVDIPGADSDAPSLVGGLNAGAAGTPVRASRFRRAVDDSKNTVSACGGLLLLGRSEPACTACPASQGVDCVAFANRTVLTADGKMGSGAPLPQVWFVDPATGVLSYSRPGEASAPSSDSAVSVESDFLVFGPAEKPTNSGSTSNQTTLGRLGLFRRALTSNTTTTNNNSTDAVPGPVDSLAANSWLACPASALESSTNGSASTQPKSKISRRADQSSQRVESARRRRNGGRGRGFLDRILNRAFRSAIGSIFSRRSTSAVRRSVGTLRRSTSTLHRSPLVRRAVERVKFELPAITRQLTAVLQAGEEQNPVVIVAKAVLGANVPAGCSPVALEAKSVANMAEGAYTYE